MDNLTMIVAIGVPAAGFFSAWGGIKYASRQFRAELEKLGHELAELRSQLHRDELSYVQQSDCRAIRDDCAAIHQADDRTLCYKIDSLADNIKSVSEAQKALSIAIQGLLVAVGKLEVNKPS